MTPQLIDLVCRSTGASRTTTWTPLQTLWSGYGKIYRVALDHAEVPSVVVKMVTPPDVMDQPRGWNTDQSHQRKLRSYHVEASWYRDWNHRAAEVVRVAKCYAVEPINGGSAFVLEDLDDAGFPLRWNSPSLAEIQAGLNWLARFHCHFMGQTPCDLWNTGTYWHLATRPDELAVMDVDDPLRIHASQIDQRLSECEFPTFVHGDAKIANFCIAEDLKNVAAVDFQYVGGGCAMKDVVYFLGSCLSEGELTIHASDLIDSYFQDCRLGWLEARPVSLFETESRNLLAYAWADFERFLRGWHPQHKKLTGYSRKMTQLAIERLRA